MNLKDNSECSCGKEETNIFGNHPKSEYLSNKEPRVIKILQDEDKRGEFQLLLKEMEERLSAGTRRRADFLVG